MKSKKKIVLSVVSVVVILGIIAGALAIYFTRYHKDENDTEEFYRQNVASVGYENTVETAYPFTDVYGIIDEHFRSELPEGKTEKKVAVIGYDGCRADIVAEKQDNGAINYLLNNGASINLTYCGGVNYPAENTQATSTAPGWCSMLTGVWSGVHGITKTVEPKMLMTTLVEEGIIDNAAFITKWKGHFIDEDSTYKDEKASVYNITADGNEYIGDVSVTDKKISLSLKAGQAAAIKGIF